jgi:leader peptidase (prepilin peptidase)/N-methyltransferase
MFTVGFVFLFGAIWGSFLAASHKRLMRLIIGLDRVYSGGNSFHFRKYLRLSLISFFTSKSRCDSCKHLLPWHQNIPLVSFILLKGCCSWCGKKIDKKLLFIEFFSGVLFVLFYQISAQNIAIVFFGILFLSFLYLISDFDFRYLVIPDIYSYLVLWLGISFTWFGFSKIDLFDALLAVVVAYSVLKLLSLIYLIFLDKYVLGEADPLLAGALSVWLGWEVLPVFFLLSSILGFVWVFIASFSSGQSAWNQRIPFGPSLCFSAAIIFIYKIF